MSSLNKLKDILRQQEQLHRYPINYTIPELWDCDHIAVQSGGLPVGNGEIIVNPYRFFADLIDHWLKDRDASDAATPYYRHHTLPKELRKGNWIRQSFIYSCMIRSSGSWDHDRSGKLEEADLYGLQENGTFVKTLALLPLLKKMGIDTLYLLPVMKYSRKNKKGELGSPYSVKNFFELDSSLKDPMTCDQMSVDEEFQALVEACHLLDIKVIIDIIPRTNAIDSDLIAEHPDWFYWIESNELEGYRPPLVPGVEPGVSAQQQYLCQPGSAAAHPEIPSVSTTERSGKMESADSQLETGKTGSFRPDPAALWNYGRSGFQRLHQRSSASLERHYLFPDVSGSSGSVAALSS